MGLAAFNRARERKAAEAQALYDAQVKKGIEPKAESKEESVVESKAENSDVLKEPIRIKRGRKPKAEATEANSVEKDVVGGAAEGEQATE